MKYIRTDYQVTWREKLAGCNCIRQETFMYTLQIRVADHPDLDGNRRNYWTASFEPQNTTAFEENPPKINDDCGGLGFSTVEEAIDSATEQMKLFIKTM